MPSVVSPPILGESVVLRDWRSEDLPALREWLRPHHEWHRWDGPYFPRPTDVEAEAFCERLREDVLNSAWPTPRHRLVVADRVTDTLIGQVSWYYESEASDWRRVGVVLYDPASWSAGRGTEALRLWAAHLFATTDVVRLDFATWSGNIGMCRIGQKLGWREEARFREAREVDGRRYDGVVYGVLRGELSDCTPMPDRLETERFHLSREELGDAPWLAELFSHRASGPVTEAQARERIDAMHRLTGEHGIGAYVLRPKDGSPPVGYAAIILGRRSSDEPELAYELFPAAHGHGYATEAARAVLAAAFATGRRRIWATTRPSNAASLRVLAKLGGFEHVRTTSDEKGPILWFACDRPDVRTPTHRQDRRAREDRGDPRIHLRPATTTDLDLLERLLVEAFSWSGEPRVTLDEVRTDPRYTHHLAGWQRATDLGVVAEHMTGAPIGAAWARLATSATAGYGFVADDVPELGMAVLAPHRGIGLGGRLLDACLATLRHAGHTAVSLSVEDGNDVARRLYESRGFHLVGRVGGSDTLLLRL